MYVHAYREIFEVVSNLSQAIEKNGVKNNE